MPGEASSQNVSFVQAPGVGGRAAPDAGKPATGLGRGVEAVRAPWDGRGGGGWRALADDVGGGRRMPDWSHDVSGARTMSAVQSAQGPQAARPMLALVACTLARQLTKEIEALPAPNSGVFGALDAHEIHIRFLEQKAAGGRCEWLLGYCAFLRAWLRREM